MKEPTLAEKLSVTEKWIRLLFMILFVVVMYIATLVVYVIAVVNFIYALFVGKPLKALLAIGDTVSQYIYQGLRFLTFVTDKKPFPFDEKWPTSSLDLGQKNETKPSK